MKITIELGEAEVARLETLGAVDAQSKTALARETLVQALTTEFSADQEWARLTDDRKALEATERIWTLEELERADDLAS